MSVKLDIGEEIEKLNDLIRRTMSGRDTSKYLLIFVPKDLKEEVCVSIDGRLAEYPMLMNLSGILETALKDRNPGKEPLPFPFHDD